MEKTAKLSNLEIEKLLEYVRTKEFLFNLRDDRHKNRPLKKQTWKYIAEEINKDRQQKTSKKKKTTVSGILSTYLNTSHSARVVHNTSHLDATLRGRPLNVRGRLFERDFAQVRYTN